MNKRRNLVLAAFLTSLAVGLGACGHAEDNPTKQARPVGNAEAEQSPQASDTDGEVIAAPARFANVADMAVLGDRIALRSRDAIGIGTREDLERGSLIELDIDSTCGDLAAGADVFLLTCPSGDDPDAGGTVYLIDPDSPSFETQLSSEHRLTTATQTSNGDVIAGGSGSTTVVTFPHDAPDSPTTLTVTDPVDQVVSVPYSGHRDPTVVINRKVTTIQGLDRDKDKQGARLRAGAGVGTVAPGQDGMFLAADTEGNQLLVYTRLDVIRLHQSLPVDPSPWAVAWDSSRQLAWIASTARNSLVGYSLSSGEPVERHRVATVANAQHLGVLDDGTLVLASTSGDGLQFISAL